MSLSDVTSLNHNQDQDQDQDGRRPATTGFEFFGCGLVNIDRDIVYPPVLPGHETSIELRDIIDVRNVYCTHRGITIECVAEDAKDMVLMVNHNVFLFSKVEERKQILKEFFLKK